MGEDYYKRKALELLAIAQATRDPSAASWLRGIAIGYERLARNAAQRSEQFQNEQCSNGIRPPAPRPGTFGGRHVDHNKFVLLRAVEFEGCRVISPCIPEACRVLTLRPASTHHPCVGIYIWACSIVVELCVVWISLVVTACN